MSNIQTSGTFNGWEIGKTYLLDYPTYGKATIFAVIHNTERDGKSRIIGATLDGNGKTDNMDWSADGCFHIDGRSSGLDLTKREVAL